MPRYQTDPQGNKMRKVSLKAAGWQGSAFCGLKVSVEGWFTSFTYETERSSKATNVILLL